jgi:hypothetical protein
MSARVLQSQTQRGPRCGRRSAGAPKKGTTMVGQPASSPVATVPARPHTAVSVTQAVHLNVQPHQRGLSIAFNELCAYTGQRRLGPDTVQPCMAGRSKRARGRPPGRNVPTAQPRPPLQAQHPRHAHKTRTLGSAPAPPWCTTAVQRGKSQSCGTSPTISTPEGMSPASTAPRPPHPAACTFCRVDGPLAAVTCSQSNRA